MEIHERIISDLKAWDAIEDHRTATAGDNATADWLAGLVRGLGLVTVIDRFPFTRRVLHECSITVGKTRLAGVPLFDGGVTAAESLRARLGKPGDAGTIALVHFEPQGDAASTRSLTAARNRGDHPAVVAVAAGERVKPGLALLNADAYAQPHGPPVLQVETAHGAVLEQARRDGAEIEFVAHVTLEETHASNVHVTIPGRVPELAPLVVMTPRSAWWTCTAERGGGIVVWLECLRHFARDPPERRVIFTANTGHELGHVGLDQYLRSHESLVRNAHAWVHLGANFAAAGGSIRLQASSEDLLSILHSELVAAEQERAIDRAPDTTVSTTYSTTPIESRPLGEARNIFDGGGRYVSILGGNPLFHHPEDRWPDAIDLPRTVALTRGMVKVVVGLAESSS